ncbi:MAG: hypothetical protein ACE5GS_16110 [Kiloniellaceae bacterium]
MSSSGSSPRARRYGRRAFLSGAARAGLLGLAALAASAHTPYRQWLVYRKRHMLIVASKSDREAYRLGAAVAETLAKYLPGSKARPSRAPTKARLASLLSTGQMDVAVLARADAAALAAGAGRFKDYGPLDLRALFALGAHVLVARADFPKAHAFLVVQTLDRNRAELPVAGARLPNTTAEPVPLHSGALAYLEGRRAPGAAAGDSPG